MINPKHPKASSLTEDQVFAIESLHKVRDEIVRIAYNAPTVARTLFKLWEANEYILQDLWGFDRDPKYHFSYEFPHCTCPKLDNDDAYPYMRYIHGDCPIHGEENEDNK
jgi:hypothetical protein